MSGGEMDWFLVISAVVVGQAVGLCGAWLALSAALRAMSALAPKRVDEREHGPGALF